MALTSFAPRDPEKYPTLKDSVGKNFSKRGPSGPPRSMLAQQDATAFNPGQPREMGLGEAMARGAYGYGQDFMGDPVGSIKKFGRAVQTAPLDYVPDPRVGHELSMNGHPIAGTALMAMDVADIMTGPMLPLGMMAGSLARRGGRELVQSGARAARGGLTTIGEQMIRRTDLDRIVPGQVQTGAMPGNWYLRAIRRAEEVGPESGPASQWLGILGKDVSVRDLRQSGVIDMLEADPDRVWSREEVTTLIENRTPNWTESYRTEAPSGSSDWFEGYRQGGGGEAEASGAAMTADELDAYQLDIDNPWPEGGDTPDADFDNWFDTDPADIEAPLLPDPTREPGVGWNYREISVMQDPEMPVSREGQWDRLQNGEVLDVMESAETPAGASSMNLKIEDGNLVLFDPANPNAPNNTTVPATFENLQKMGDAADGGLWPQIERGGHTKEKGEHFVIRGQDAMDRRGRLAFVVDEMQSDAASDIRRFNRKRKMENRRNLGARRGLTPEESAELELSETVAERNLNQDMETSQGLWDAADAREQELEDMGMSVDEIMDDPELLDLYERSDAMEVDDGSPETYVAYPSDAQRATDPTDPRGDMRRDLPLSDKREYNPLAIRRSFQEAFDNPEYQSIVFPTREGVQRVPDVGSDAATGEVYAQLEKDVRKIAREFGIPESSIRIEQAFDWKNTQGMQNSFQLHRGQEVSESLSGALKEAGIDFHADDLPSRFEFSEMIKEDASAFNSPGVGTDVKVLSGDAADAIEAAYGSVWADALRANPAAHQRANKALREAMADARNPGEFTPGYNSLVIDLPAGGTPEIARSQATGAGGGMRLAEIGGATMGGLGLANALQRQSGDKERRPGGSR